MEHIGTDEPQEQITLSGGEANQEQIWLERRVIEEEIGLQNETTKEMLEQELQEAEQEYSERIKRNQEAQANQAHEEIKLLKKGIDLIILTNQRSIKLKDSKIKQLSKEMEQKIKVLGFNNYEDIMEEIIDLQEKLKQPIFNQVKKKCIEYDLSNCLEVQALHKEIQNLLYKNNYPSSNNEQLEKEYNQLLEQLGTTLEVIQQDIQECKNEIQKYIGKNEKKEIQARQNLVKYERLDELATILQKYERSNIPNQNNKQVYDQMYNHQEQEDAQQMNEESEAAFQVHKQQKLIEAIVANYERTKNNVQSFEKILNNCLFHLWNKIQPKKYANEISNEELLSLLEDLQLREQIEELGVNQEINKAISYIKTNQNYDQVFDTLKVLAFNSSLNAFNFLEFIHLMDIVEQTSNIIKDKDIILFLGVAGCGKSTTIQYLCGSTMKAMKIKGLNHIEAVEVQNNQLKNIKSSPFAKPETRYVTPIIINLQDLGYFMNQEVILVDSPGSGDLESVEADLANTLGMFKLVRQARSIRLVLLFSYQNLGNRFEHLKDQLKFYSSIIDDLEENCKSITYAFTQISQDQTDQIAIKLRNIYAELNKEEQNNRDLKIFLEDAINKSFQEEIIVINPLDKKPLQVLQRILINVIARTKKIFQLYGDKVKEFIKRQQVVDNVISEIEIKEVKENLKKLDEMKPIKKQCFDDEEEIKGMSDYEIEIRELTLKICSNLNEKEIDDRMWDISLAKIEVFSKEFEICYEVDKLPLEYYQEKLQEHLELQENSVRNEIQRPDFEKINKENSSQSESSKLFQKLIKPKETLKNPRYLQLLDQAMEQQEKQIKQKFEAIYNDNIQKYLIQDDNNPNFNHDVALQINNYLKLLELFYFNYNQQSKNLKSFFEQQQKDLKSNMLELFNKCLIEFKNFLQQENYIKLKLTYGIILSIKSIKALYNDIYFQFYQLSYDIDQQMKNFMEQIDKILHNLAESDSNEIEIQLRQLRSSLRNVKQLSKIMDNEYLLEEFNKEVQQELGDWKYDLMRKIPPKVFGMLQHDKLEETLKVHNLLLKIEQCFSILQIEDNNLSNDLKGQLDETFELIQFSITQIDNNYEQFSIRKGDFDLLYHHFLTIKIAEKYRYEDFQNKHSKSTIMLSALDYKILEIVKKQAILISQEFKKFFEQLYNLSEDVQDKSEQQL